MNKIWKEMALWFSERIRPAKVLGIVVVWVGFLWLTYPSWMPALQATKGFNLGTLWVTLFAAPVAFVIWLFRNEDKTKELENNRVDTLIKDFHQIERWATGVEIDIKSSLRTAAIHQLRPYLTGEYGMHFFRRPAYEIYRSLLDEEDYSDIDGNSYPKLPGYISAIHTVIREVCSETGNWRKVFNDDDGLHLLKLNLRFADLTGISLEGAILFDTFLEEVDQSTAHLYGNNLTGISFVGAHLEGANLTAARLDGADLSLTRLEGANLTAASLVRSTLRYAHLEKVDLRGARLDKACLMHAYFEETNLERTHLNGADLCGAELVRVIFDDTYYSPSTFWPDGFDPTEYKGLVLEEDEENDLE